MANRRMLSRTIVESGEFEELSPMAQLLYMRMNLVADDDGFADCYALSRLLGTTQDEFDELADAGFIKKVQGRKCLYHIRHWRTHNSLEKAKYHAKDYRDTLTSTDTKHGIVYIVMYYPCVFSPDRCPYSFRDRKKIYSKTTLLCNCHNDTVIKLWNIYILPLTNGSTSVIIKL